ncbi:hypothetical protein, partial [Burkholderia gladioli]|uniref:hypothetical protein n=1 Tax=Burkholderia gladioli TaxID=28095 RepID=UPI001ABAEDB0
ISNSAATAEFPGTIVFIFFNMQYRVLILSKSQKYQTIRQQIYFIATQKRGRFNPVQKFPSPRDFFLCAEYNLCNKHRSNSNENNSYPEAHFLLT